MTEENKIENSIIPTGSTGLVRVGNSISITNKILNEINEKKKSINASTTKIGKQIWMSENLNVEKFRNGDKIPTARTSEEWERAGILGEPISSYYPIEELSNNQKGIKLYNWYAIKDPRCIAPQGFHIPNDQEWDDLIQYIDSNVIKNIRGSQSAIAGSLLKSKNGWNENKNGLDKFGFNGSPTGSITAQGKSGAFNEWAFWWSASECSKDFAWIRYIHFKDDKFFRTDYGKKIGFAVRCIKDYE
jgi:uncharacterized protein (TIGR02145 family)